MKIIEKSFLMGLIISILLQVTLFSGQCESISNKVLRLHILANSNSSEDQSLKLKVRDKILECSSNIFENVQDKNNAEKVAADQLETIKQIAQQEIYDQGFDYKVHVELTNMHFNTRHYNEVTLPAGNYDAVRVLIGEGKGKNWWCVMFPPMCLPAAEKSEELEDVLSEDEMNLVSNHSKYEVRFKLVDWFEEVRDWFNGDSAA